MSIKIQEFLATDEEVEIVVNQPIPVIRLITSQIGPFKTFQKTKCPLWLAIELKKKQRCKIIIPDWLNFESLKEFLKTEEEHEEFGDIHVHYLEISSLLFKQYIIFN